MWLSFVLYGFGFMRRCTASALFWMDLVGNDRYVEEKLMIEDGVDMHHVLMILIALMLYGHTRAVGPTSSMTRGPPIE
jgi:hypothetical protein